MTKDLTKKLEAICLESRSKSRFALANLSRRGAKAGGGKGIRKIRRTWRGGVETRVGARSLKKGRLRGKSKVTERQTSRRDCTEEGERVARGVATTEHQTGAILQVRDFPQKKLKRPQLKTPIHGRGRELNAA